MAGIMAMGDLSHELETLVISIDEGRIKASRAVDELLQHSVDELHRMRDTVIAGKPVAAANALLKRIQQAIAGFEVADEAQVEIAPTDEEVEKAVPAEFTIEPDDTVSMVIIDTPLADELEQIGRPAPDQDAAPQITERQQAAESEPEPAPAPEPEPAPAPEPVRATRKAVQKKQRQEFARIDADLLEDLLNAAGEISIYQSRLSQQVSSFEFHVD